MFFVFTRLEMVFIPQHPYLHKGRNSALGQMTYSSPLAGDERRSVPDFLPEKLAKIQIEKCQRVYGYGSDV